VVSNVDTWTKNVTVNVPYLNHIHGGTSTNTLLTSLVFDTASMKTPEMNTQRSASGFTLVEMLVSVAVLTIVIVGTFNVFVQSIRSYNETSLMRKRRRARQRGVGPHGDWRGHQQRVCEKRWPAASS